MLVFGYIGRCCRNVWSIIFGYRSLRGWQLLIGRIGDLCGYVIGRIKMCIVGYYVSWWLVVILIGFQIVQLNRYNMSLSLQYSSLCWRYCVMLRQCGFGIFGVFIFFLIVIIMIMCRIGRVIQVVVLMLRWFVMISWFGCGLRVWFFFCLFIWMRYLFFFVMVVIL